MDSANGLIAPLAEDTRFDWLLHLRKTGNIQAPAKDRDELLATLLTTPGLPQLEVPEELRFCGNGSLRRSPGCASAPKTASTAGPA